jgi:hypothetical protein
MLALFSAIAATGSGLHFLPGVGHDHGCPAEPLSPVASGVGATAGDADDEHCPVCQYFTQAQTVPLLVAFEIDLPVVYWRITTIRPLLADQVAAAYNSRAPPSCG